MNWRHQKWQHLPKFDVILCTQLLGTAKGQPHIESTCSHQLHIMLTKAYKMHINLNCLYQLQTKEKLLLQLPSASTIEVSTINYKWCQLLCEPSYCTMPYTKPATRPRLNNRYINDATPCLHFQCGSMLWFLVSWTFYMIQEYSTWSKNLGRHNLPSNLG